jgi:hypothetical protein
LNGSQYLRALRDGVVFREEDLGVDAQLATSVFCGVRLLDLVIVIVGHQGNEEFEFSHARKFPGWNELLRGF